MAVSFFLILNLIPFTAPINAGNGRDEKKARIGNIKTTDDRFGRFDDLVDLLFAVHNGEQSTILGFAFLEEIAQAWHEGNIVAHCVADTSKAGTIEHGNAYDANIFPGVEYIVAVIDVIEDENNH